MAVHDTDPKRSADARVEHTIVPDGDGYIRWHTVDQGRDASGHGTGHDTDDGGADPAGKGAFDDALDLVKRKLSGWR